MNIDEVTYRINGAVYEVNRVLGAGVLEKVYGRSLVIELEGLASKCNHKFLFLFFYKDSLVGDYFADIVVDNRVIVELKAVKQLDKSHEAQLLNYLKATRFKVGLLVNFTSENSKIKRFVL